MKSNKLGYILTIAALIAAIVLLFLLKRENKTVPKAILKVDSLAIKVDSIKAKAESVALERAIVQIKYKTKIQIEYEKINRVDSLPICAVADSIAKYYKPPDR
jgi:hypothetical protein